MTDVWQSGHTYIPGSIVRPATSTATTPAVLTNGNFETGDLTGWSVLSGTWTVIAGGYSGTYKANVAGTGVTQLMSGYFQVSPGNSCSVSAVATLFNAGTDDQAAGLVLRWFDASHAFISDSAGHTTTGQGGSWKSLTAAGNAPANAAYVAVILSTNNGTHGGQVGWDNVVLNAPFQGPPAGLVYKATQAAPGKSGATEPAWPGNTTTPVTDNQVTWQGVIATQLVWTAVPINKSGTTEPTWPTQPGAAVHDGSIDWVATVPVVTDTNWPSSKITTIAASKIYKADKDIVKYSATVNPLDWSTKDDAGYLPFGLQTYGDNPAVAMGLYRSNLVVFSSSGFQMWQVDEDPANSALMDALPIATSYHKALSPVANDLLFLSSEGVRSMGVAASGVNLQAGDVGMPIDPLVLDALTQATNDPTVNILSTFIPARAQYWLAFSNFPTANLTITGDMPNGAIGAFISGAYTVTGGQPPYTISLNSGALPPGITLNPDGSYIGYYTAQGSYSWQIKAVDSIGTIALKNDGAIVAGMSVSGTVPNGAIGDTVDTYYTASAGHAPYTYAIIAGALPPGLTMGADGHVTGTFTTVGSYSWTVQATDSYGNTATVPGSNTVSLPLIGGHWAAMNTTDLQLYLSNDPVSWPSSPFALSNTTALGNISPEYDGGALAFGGSTGNNALVIANQAQISPLTSAAVNAQNPGYRIKAVGGLLFKYGNDTVSGYAYSTDHGSTWTQVNRGDLLTMHGIDRLSNGRWLAQLTHNAGQTYQYSDQAIPTTWTPATVTVAGSFVDILECDGTTALSPNNSGVLYKTTDGATWTQMAGGFPQNYGANMKVARCIGNGSFLFPGHEGDGKFWVTHNSGVTWTQHTRVSGNDGYLIGISAHGSTVVLCWTGGVTGFMGIDVSHDGGDTWTAATLPWSSPTTKYPLCAFLG